VLVGGRDGFKIILVAEGGECTFLEWFKRKAGRGSKKKY